MEDNIKQEEEEISIDKAVFFINQIAGECSAMGANSYEIPTLKGLLEEVQTGLITPKDAYDRAREIRNSKQDYH